MGPIPYDINVIFKSPCQPPYTTLSLQTGSSSLPANIDYYITDPVLNYQLPRYQATPTNSLCPSSIILYDVKERAGSAIDAALFNFNSLSQTLSI
jgi:hypothetical protein